MGCIGGTPVCVHHIALCKHLNYKTYALKPAMSILFCVGILPMEAEVPLRVKDADARGQSGAWYWLR